MTDYEGLELAQAEVSRLEAGYSVRAESCAWSMDRRSVLQKEYSQLRTLEDLDGENHGAAIAKILEELDQLDATIKRWNELEPELSNRISAAKKLVADREVAGKRAQVLNLLDAEKAIAIQLFANYKSLFNQAIGLQAMIDRKYELQAELGISHDGLGSVSLPKVSPYGLPAQNIEYTMGELKKALLIG